MYVPNASNLCSFYNVDAHVGVKDSAILLTYAIRQAMGIGWIMIEKPINLCFHLSTPTEEGIETISLEECKNHADG